jgi:hypothetical protein
MRFFNNKNIYIKYIVIFFITIFGLALLAILQMRDKSDLQIEKIVLSFNEDDSFNIEPYIDCLYELNMDKSSKCIEGEVKSLIGKGKASDVLQIIRVMDKNEENIFTNCQYVAERIGKVFNNITDLESLLGIDFSFCNYGFQMGVFGEIDENFLKDDAMLILVKKSCADYITRAGPNGEESGACHKSIANILTGSASTLNPLESKEFCLAIGDLEGVCLSSLLKNYVVNSSSSKLSKDLFSNKEVVVETLLNFCKGGGVDQTRNCLTEAIAILFAFNEKLVYLVADYCAEIKLNIRKSCYREIANGFNKAIESVYSKENQESVNKAVEPAKILKIFIDNQPKYCSFLEDVVELGNEYVDQCYIGFALVLLEYYEIDKDKVCKYFNKKEYGLCRVGVKIHKGGSIEAKYKVAS